MRRLFLYITLLIGYVPLANAQEIDSTEDAEDVSVREQPTIEEDNDEIVSIPHYIKNNFNHIIFNGSDWSEIRKSLSNVNTEPFSIVHIGDSHLQADISTSVVRQNLQLDYGNAGRGLITPLRMSGTNQPRDYGFSSTQSWSAAKLMKWPWQHTMGFTGTSVSPNQRQSHIAVSTSNANDYNPFSSVTLFHNGKLNVTRVEDRDGRLIMFSATPSQDYTHIELSRSQDYVKIYFDSAGDMTLFGANLSGNRPGIFYHVIGNNGAAYSTYNRIGNVGKGIAPLNPDLVIISLGTNEAFGRRNISDFTKAIDRLVTSVKEENPKAQILLVTPMECQKSTYSTVNKTIKGKSRKGKKRRRSRVVKKKIKSYTVNENILPLRNAILTYGKDHSIAVYDWYQVAGGSGASALWLGDKLYGSDRIHHTYKGYHLQGQLFYEALSEALKGNNN